MSSTITTRQCGFCGKGPFPSVPGLNCHIQQSVACHRASQKEFGSYRDNIWHSDRRSIRPENVPLPEDNNDDWGLDLDQDINDTMFVPQPAFPAELPTPVDVPRQASVEEVPDEGEPESHYVEEFPIEQKAGAAWGRGRPKFEEIREKLEADATPWGPFEDQEEWELAEWLMKNVGQTQADHFLKLPIVSQPCMYRESPSYLVYKTQNRTQPSFSNKRNLFEKIDALPTKGPEWTCDIISAQGDLKDDDGALLPPEKLELWRRDPVECVRELLGNPALKEYLTYAPERVWADVAQENQVYDEMATGEWWWETQVSR